MHTPDAVEVATGTAFAAIAGTTGLFLPRLWRLSHHYPATRQPVLAWSTLCALCLANAAVRLAGAPGWAALALEAAGLPVAGAMLWRCRTAIRSALRRAPRAEAGPPAGTPLEIPPEPTPPPGRTWPSNPGGISVTSVDQARRRYGRDR